MPEKILNCSKIHLPIAVSQIVDHRLWLDLNANDSIVGSTVIDGTRTSSIKEILPNRYEISTETDLVPIENARDIEVVVTNRQPIFKSSCLLPFIDIVRSYFKPKTGHRNQACLSN